MFLVIAKAVILFLASALNIILGLMVYMKNSRSKVNISLGLVGLFSGIFTFAYGADYGYILFKYSNLEQVPYHYTHVFFSRLTYMGALVPAPFTMFLLYLKSAKNIRIKGIILYTTSSAIFLLALSTPAMIQSMTFKNGLLESIPGPLAVIGRVYFIISILMVTYISYSYYRISAGLQKIQAKYMMTGTLIYGLSSTVVAGLLPVLRLGNYTEFAPVSSLFFVGFSAYAIIRYRFLDIETVMHKTLLWIAVSITLFIPGLIVFKYLYPWLSHVGYVGFSIALLMLFYLYLPYYNAIQPRINHLFRRKKYDYQQMIVGVGDTLSGEITIDGAIGKLVEEVCGLMYVRNGVAYIEAKEGGEYSWYGGKGYPQTEQEQLSLSLPLAARVKEVKIPTRGGFIAQVRKKPEIVDSHLLSMDPEYAHVKEEGLKLLRDTGSEIVVPLLVKQRVLGLLGLGKKESLQLYTIQDMEALEKLGKGAGISLYNALHYSDILEKERLAGDMRIGRDIQNNLVPKEAPQVMGLNIAGEMIPAKEIGGDYYDYIVTSSEAAKKERLSVVIGDVSGKGVGAGLIMAATKAALEGFSEQALTPKEILCKLNRFLNRYTKHEKFMTMLYLEWDAAQKKLNYSSAGHEHIIIYRHGDKLLAGSLKPNAESKSEKQEATDIQPSASSIQQSSVEVIQSGGVMLGMIDNIAGFLEDRELRLNTGDKVVLYTDGITEAHNSLADLYTLERLTAAVKTHGHKSTNALKESLKQDVFSFIGAADQYDDITLVVMEAT